MCGIAGFLASDGARPNPSWLRTMCDRLIHRGPDGYGEFFDKHVALGHRRLSIIDLSGGAQPLGNEDGSIQIVFNGEIYNFLELRQELIAKGHRFTTRSDTEVLVHLYEDHGERMPEFLNGMFALAIWDTQKGQLFLARDRFGEKPLYYTFDIPGLQLCFASELKALTAIPGFKNQVNQESVAEFLSNSYIADPNTIYHGVYRLRPAYTLVVDRSGHRFRQYWKPAFDINPSANFPDTVDRIRSLSAEAVKMRMISDVALGGFLSGGVDSSGVVAEMAVQAPDRVRTFSIGFPSAEFDELDYARLVATRYKTDHRERIVTPDIGEMLAVLVDQYDEPFGDSSAIPTLVLSRMTRQDVTVALSGDGADEVFGGYRRYRFGMAEDRLRRFMPPWFRRSVLRTAGDIYPKFDYLPRAFRAKATLKCLSQELGDAYYSSMSVFRDERLTSILSPDLLRDLHGYSPREVFRNRFEPVSHLPALQQMQAVDLETYLPGDILVKVDRATMAYSLESRAPWLDHRLAEIAGSLPSSFKVRGKQGKFIFKEALRPLLPETIISRPKMGFGVPLAEWFRSALKPIFEAAVMESPMEEFVNPKQVARLWQDHQSGWHNRGSELWNLLMLGLWNARYHNKAGQGLVSEALAMAG